MQCRRNKLDQMRQVSGEDQKKSRILGCLGIVTSANAGEIGSERAIGLSTRCRGSPTKLQRARYYVPITIPWSRQPRRPADLSDSR
jgi:hypothetical protein